MQLNVRLLRRHPSAMLLLVQLLGIVLYPLMETTATGRALLGAFGILVLALALLVVNRSPSVNWVAWLLGLPSVVCSLTGTVQHISGLVTFAQVLECLLYFYTAASLIAYMLEDHRVTSDELFAVGATFTLLAWGFAFAFSLCQQAYPGSFGADHDPSAPRTWMELLYLSFSVLSAVGLSDIVPVHPLARALVMLEQFAGVMYIALVVSRLIGLSTARAQRRDGASKD